VPNGIGVVFQKEEELQFYSPLTLSAEFWRNLNTSHASFRPPPL